MILRRAKLKNFISHANTEIEFPPFSVTVLVGPNGAGKTSVVDAVVFALFGDKVRGEKVEDMIRRGTSSAEIELTFDVGKEYTVHWVRKKRSVEATLSRSDAGVIADTKEAVLEEISRILKMDKESAMNSIFVRQGEIASLVDADPRTRKNLLGKLIGLDRLERAWKNMKEVISYFEGTKNELEARVKEIKKELEVRGEQRNKLRKEVEELMTKINDLGRRLAVIAKELELAKNELENWNEKKRKYDELTRELDQLAERMKSVIREIERLEGELKQAEEAKKRVKELEPEVNKIPLLEEYAKKSGELNELAREKDQLNKDLNRISDIRHETEESMEWCKDYVEHEKIEEIEVKVLEEPSAIEKFVTKTSTEVKNTIKQIEEKTNEVNDLVSKALEVLPEPTIEAKNAKLHELKAKKERIEEEISRLKDEQGRIRGRISDLKQALEMLGEADTCPVCKTKLSPEHRERVKDKVQEEMGLLKGELEKVKRELKEQEQEKKEVEKELDCVSKVDIERIERLRKEIAEDRKEVVRLYSTLHTITHLINSLEDKIKAKISAVGAEIGKIERILNGLIEKIGYKPDDPEKELRELRKKKEEYDRLKPIADRYEEIKQKLGEEQEKLKVLEMERERIQKEVKELGYDEKKHEDARKRYEELLIKFERTEAELEEKKGLLKRKQGDLKEVERKIAELEENLNKLREELEIILKFVGKLDNIRSAFSRDGVQKLLRQKITPLMSEFARNYVERFNLDITDVSVNEDFDISIIKEGGEISIKSISGGERVAVAIALRLAIAKALAGKISTIIMDEPTTHLDEERRKELVEIMRSFFREGAAVPQMIIVTHHRELEEIADTVYQVEKVDGVSKVVEVSL